MEYCITVNPIPHSQYRTKFDYEWSIEYQLMRNPLVSINIRSASLLIFKILYYGMCNIYIQICSVLVHEDVLNVKSQSSP